MSKCYVLTVILSEFNHDSLIQVTQFLTEQLNTTDVTVLSTGKAIDVHFDDDSLVDDTVDNFLSDNKADWYCQPAENRKKKMLVADMDSTMITIECIDELADFAGIKDKVSEITERAMQGELDFASALHERVALLKGMSADVLDECYRTRVKFTEGAKALVKTMERDGAITALVSGGFTYFTDKVSTELGFQVNRANILEISDGKLSGKIILPISDSSTKINTLNELAKQHGLDKDQIIAVGDGANDIPMIEGAGIGAAYRAKEKARLAADFEINHTDLSSLLFIQGYCDQDFYS